MENPSAIFVSVTRSASVTNGELAVLTVTITLDSCSTLLCLRLCSNAAGAFSGLPVRNIAVPGTRDTEDFVIDLMNAVRGTLSRRTFSVTIRVPRIQVQISSMMAAPKISGM